MMLSMGLMVADYRGHYLNPTRQVFNSVVAPLQYIVDLPIEFTQNIIDGFSSRKALVAENTALKSEHLLLQAQLQQLTALQNENSQLRALLTSYPRLENQAITVAKMLAVATDPLVSEVVLSGGAKNGIYEGQPVLDAYGVMGQIIAVGPLTSRLLLLSDSRSAVPVQVARNGVRGIVIGQGKLSNLQLSDVPPTADIRVGDLLISSGLGGRFPADYPVGVIEKILHDPGEQFMKVEVKPSAHLDRNEPVLLIWPPKSIPVDVESSKMHAAFSAGEKFNMHESGRSKIT